MSCITLDADTSQTVADVPVLLMTPEMIVLEIMLKYLQGQVSFIACYFRDPGHELTCPGQSDETLISVAMVSTFINFFSSARMYRSEMVFHVYEIDFNEISVKGYYDEFPADEITMLSFDIGRIITVAPSTPGIIFNNSPDLAGTVSFFMDKREVILCTDWSIPKTFETQRCTTFVTKIGGVTEDMGIDFSRRYLSLQLSLDLDEYVIILWTLEEMEIKDRLLTLLSICKLA